MKQRHVRLKKLISLSVSVFLFILAMEVSARIDDKIKYHAPFFGLYSSQRLRNTDSDGINCNVPNVRYEKWKINQLGFRGPDITLIKPKDVIRIICMGTSESFGLYESPGKEWPNQLMDILNEFQRFQVINTSVVGLPLKKYVRYIEKYVLKLEPDLIILYVNPFGYAVGANKFAERQAAPRIDANITSKGWKISLKDVTSNLRMLPKIKQAAKRIVPMQALKSYRLLNMKKQLRALEHRRLNGRNPLDVVSQESLYTLRTDLEELIRFLRHWKIEVILSSYPVLISPENIDEHHEIFLDHRRFYIELSLLGIIDASLKFNELVQSFATTHGIDFVDNNSNIPKNLKYFADNVHYTDEGAKLVAKNFAQCIKSLFLH